MKSLKAWRVRPAFLVFGMMLWASDSFSGTGEQGFNVQGFNVQGFNVQGFNVQGFNVQGFNVQGFNVQGFNVQGFNVQGFNVQGFNVQGFNVQGFNVQGFNVQGFNVQGFNVQGFNVQGLPLLGIDRLRGLAAPLEYRGLVFADVQTSSGRDLQGLQQVPVPPAINYVETVNPGPRLQAGPSDTNPGSYIYVPGLSGSANDIKGTFWNMLLADSTGTGAVGLYVADVAKDTVPNQSKYSSNDDVTLYTIYYRQPATREWVSLCPVDPGTGKATAMAIPLDAGDWTTDASRAKFTFACTATGVGAKCARNWGYKPWKSVGESVWNGAGFVSKSIPLQPFYDACIIAARADYCQDGQSYTKNGTLVDLFDTLDGITSLNATAGLPYTPGAQGPMMHEEYQISALDFMSLDPPSTSAKPHYVILPGGLTPEEQAALSKLRRSGMQSSRYDDLDPGRSCLAAPFVDRCDPHEPYACYRDTNMSATPYGAFLSVNSPRHCDHDEDTPGAPLDPLCNTCVSRVCSVDPTCCGDPGSTFYPGSLVWDGRCSAIRDQVCKSAPMQTKWAAGQVAAKAGTAPTVFLRGAVGSFEGIVTTNGTRFVEGWACDPDFPGASSRIQISLGGPLAAAGATLYTAVADQPLTSTLGAGWRETVAAECGGVGRHGFRFALPAAFEGDVYVYGIDLNTPGAPFMLLRGGKKTTAGGPAMPNPLSVIWTGWLEPSASGMHSFSVDATDSYRVWVNGAYLLGNFVDHDATVPGAFLMPPPAVPAPPMYLQKGVRYGVRVEYLRAGSATTNGSRFTLRWTPPLGVEAPIPASALYPAAQGAGNGLLGTYWNSAGAQNGTQTYSAADHVWTSCEPPATSCTRPAPGIRVEDAFTARFEGQVMPPVSGDYTFTADTDGAASISVNGKLVTDASRRPPGAGNPEVCGTRDICRPGSAISRTCDQGYFCSAQICLKDPSCCSITWDAACVQKVATVCHLECRPTAPIAVSLRGGVKYDIKVDFSHAGGRGARLKLFWGLDGGARDAIPLERLFAAPAGTAPAKGVGLNAAYFSDAFKAEYFDRVEPSVAFVAASPPRAALSSSIACGFSGGPACDATEALGAPALVAPAPKSLVVGPSVTLQVTGAATGSTIAIAEKTDTTSTTIATFAYVAPSDGRPMLSPPIPLALGKHKLTVGQSVSGKNSDPSAGLEFTVVAAVDPTLPASPAVTVPAGGLVATNGKITVSGTAARGAKVNVSVGGGAPTIVNANATTGAWTATINLPAPGVYPLTFTQTVGGKTTATGAQVAAKYALPAITVTAPPATETAFAGTVSVTGAATPGLTNSKVIVADGDGRYFAEVQQLDISSGGVFPAPSPAPQPPPLTLDPGRHVLKIFQRVGTPPNVLDGEPIIRSVLITPAVGALAIDCPAAPGVVPSAFTVTGRGTPARTGLRYGVAVYQGNGTTGNLSKLGQATVDDLGVFTLPVQLTGAGSQQLRARLLVSSLSGGGAAESGDSPICNVVVRPQRPTITLPANGFGQTSTTLNVRGTGLANAPLSFFAEETTNVTPATNPTVAANGTFNVNIVLARGPHRITVKQSAGVATSDASNPVTGTIGDVVPPKFTFANTPPELPPKIERTTASETGLSINFVQVSGITAKDGTTVLPVTCVPAGPSFFFPLGTTNVTCKAQDAAGNVASTTLTVTVKSSAAPLISGINLVAEATGPEGAAVAYQVSATGFVANCAPAGSTAFVPCSSWQRKSLGLGNPSSLAIDPVDGTLYAVDEADPAYGQTSKPPGTLMKSVDRGATWTPLAMPGTNWRDNRLTVVRAPTDPKATIYVPSTAGLLASLDGGSSWKTILPGIEVGAVSVDPRDPRHLFAWNRANPGDKLALLETTDGGTSWGFAADGLPIVSAPGLPDPHISGVAFDPLNAGRTYALISPDRWDDTAAPHLIYRRIGNAPWERRSVPPVLVFYRGAEDSAIAVAPKVMPCNGNPICPTFPTVFVGGVMSTDGGDTWTPNQDMVGGAISFLFDRHQDGVIYTNNYVSRDHGRTWGSWPGDPPYFLEALFQDPVPPPPGTTARIYGQYGFDAPHGVVVTADAGATWVVSKASIAGVQASINTIAVDAVDPRVAYMLSSEGLYKTQDGGDTWGLKISGALENFYPDTQLAIDPFNPRLLYVTGNWHINVQSGHMSMDGGDTVSQGLFDGVVGTDPGARNVLFHGPRGLGVSRYAQGVSKAYALDVPAFTAHYIQVLPDAARTVAVSYSRSSTAGGTILFSGRDAQVAPATTNVRPALSGMPSRPVFDNSDGRYSVFASGDARGSTPNLLYKASVSDLVFQQIGGGQPTIDFRSLVIDAGSGGQLMYTVGVEGALWQSQDGGKTWATDPGAPTYVHRVWASPVDGALYVAAGGVNIGDFRYLGTDQLTTQSTIWKRTLGATPPGASIVEGNLRVTCTGDSGRSVTPGSVFPIGTTTLSCTATDVFGAITTQPITIQVKDSTAPVLTVPAPLTVTTTSTDPSVVVPVSYTVTATDAVDGALPACVPPATQGCFSCAPASGSSFGLGVTTVSCTARDTRGKQATAAFPVTVKRTGTTPAVPTMNVPANMTVEATGPAGAQANPVVTATKSTGAALTPTCTPALTTTFPLGTTTVSCSATDSGFTVTRTFNVTVADTRAPVITVPSPGPSVSSQGSWGATVTYTATATDIVDGAVAPGCVPGSGSVFAPGTTTVVCRTSDKAGNAASAQFNVVVQDVSPPVLTVPALVLAEQQDILGARVTYSVSATDAQDPTPPIADCIPASGTWFPPGDTSVSCQATDLSGNTARKTFIVRVADTTPPEVTAPATIVLEATSSAGAPATFTVTAYDTVDQVRPSACTRPNGVNAPTPVASGATFAAGVTTVTCTAADLAGNAGTRSFDVIVRDTKGPVLTLPSTRFGDVDGSGVAVVTFTVTATDLGTPVPVVCTPPSGTRFLFGTTVVTCVARDAAGNEARGSFNVTVRDRVAPVFSQVPATITVYAPSTAGAAVTYTKPVATDAFEGVRAVTCAPASGWTFAPGQSTVTCTASDTSANTRTATFIVWVKYDTRQPDASTFLPPLRADGSSSFLPNAPINVAFALTGASAPITNLVARALIAPVPGGVPGTFVDATPASGTGNLFVYNSGPRTYVFGLSTASLGPGTYRIRADLGDGAPREVNFNVVDKTITITPPAFLFADTVVMGQGNMAHFDVRNLGTLPTTLTMILPPADFTILGNSCTGAGPIPSGGTCFVDVRFTPKSAPGQKHGELRVTATDGSTVTAFLDGRALTPAQLVLQPPTTSFGSVPLLTPGPTIDVTVRNLGEAPTGAINVSLPGPDFAVVTNACPIGNLPGLQTCHLFVRFTPMAVGARGATLTVSSNPGGNPNVSFSGVGIPPLTVSPSSLTFPGVPRGMAGQSQVITVRNLSTAGSGALTTTVAPAAFRVTANTCAGLAGGATCTVTIQWFPTAVGTTNGSFSISGAPGWQGSASLTGTGL